MLTTAVLRVKHPPCDAECAVCEEEFAVLPTSVQYTKHPINMAWINFIII
jgi:hypothetical protein